MVRFDISTVVTHLAILFNGFLIWLIWKKSGKHLESYKKILYLGAIYDLFYSLAIILTLPQIVVTHDGIWYFVVLDGWLVYFGHPYDFLILLMNVYLSNGQQTVATVQYIYRFLLLCLNITLGNIAFCILVLLALATPSWWVISFYEHFFPKPNEFETYGPFLFATGEVKKEDVKSFIVTKYAEVAPLTAYSTICSCVSFGIIIFCSIGIILKLWMHKKKFALADQKIQNEISIVLFCEALVPLLTVIIPNQLFNFLKTQLPWFPPIYTYILAFAPMFNPIVKMFVIASFRKVIFGVVLRKKKTPRNGVLFTASAVSNA